MLKKTIEYTDFDGNKREETFFFNLTKAELAEMELTTAGGLEQKINRLVSERNGQEIIGMFKEIILKAYGVKSPDGRRFIKNDEVRADFAQTEAYSELFMELANSADAAAAFMNGIVPQNLEVPKSEN